MTKRVAIIGGSISGLITGLALARRGIDVEILERDAEADDVRGDLATAERRGTPQARHSHACMALARRVLLERAPDVWTALLDAGARELPIGGEMRADGSIVPAFVDDELIGLGCRRPLLEAVLRRCALAESRVRFRNGLEVSGFLTQTRGRVPTITGVTTTAGNIRADLVIDASGRASALSGWLDGVGARPFTETASSCGVVYFSRFYEIRRWPTIRLERGLGCGGVFQSSLCIAFPGDNAGMTITLGVPAGDGDLRRVGHDPAYTRAVRLHPGLSRWLEPGVSSPISDVAPMARLENRLRRFVVEGEPIALGLLPVGDAVCITNPAFGRGVSLAFAHAFALADAVVACGDDPRALALRADVITTSLLQPWFEDAVLQDRARTSRWTNSSSPTPRVSWNAPITMADVMAAVPHDERVGHAFMRRFNMIDHPDALFADEAVMQAVRAVRASSPPPPSAGPSRQDLLAALAADREFAVSG